MIQVSFISDVLHITDTEPRLCSLTVYNGCPDIVIHYITDADKEAFIKLFLSTNEFEEEACNYCRDMGWKEPE